MSTIAESNIAPGYSPAGVGSESVFTPLRPLDLNDLGQVSDVAWNLALKTAFTVPSFSTQWMATRLKLPSAVLGKLLWEMKQDNVIEVVGQDGPLNYKFSISNQGREMARRLHEICGYLGPVPVSLNEYFEGIRQQQASREEITVEQVWEAIEGLVLPDSQKDIAALAASSGRSLFIFGPAGNGKSTLGRMLHQVIRGSCWIPYALAIQDQIIQLYDPQVHHPVPADNSIETEKNADPRWLKIKRPFVIAGGEMTLDQLDLAYDSSNRFYEAPPHLKANCGTFMIDDFGRQRAEPRDLLNRWIIPLEHQIDYLSLKTGKKIKAPFCLMLIVATNLNVNDVADTAFLRRMGYRLHLNTPNEHLFRKIILRASMVQGVPIDDTFVDYIIERYRTENRLWNASEPRDLFSRCRDVCLLKNKQFKINKEIFDLAWLGYFSNQHVDQ